MTVTGPWGEVSRKLRLLQEREVFKAAYRKAVLREAARLRGLMVEAFTKSGPKGHKWEHLATLTQLISRAEGKGDRRPLMDTGELRNAHTVVEENDVIFVGVHRRARSRLNKSMMNIAKVHEYGVGPFTIPVTDGIRKFFMWLFIATDGQVMPLKKSTTTITVRIPPRPWIGPIWKDEEQRSFRNITQRVLLEMGLLR